MDLPTDPAFFFVFPIASVSYISLEQGMYFMRRTAECCFNLVTFFSILAAYDPNANPAARAGDGHNAVAFFLMAWFIFTFVRVLPQ